jgi:DNA-binding CsgD family transcriptional regulator
VTVTLFMRNAGSLIAQIYENALEPVGWTDTLSALVQRSGGYSGVIYLNGGGALATHNYSQSAIDTYRTYFEARNPFHTFFRRRPDCDITSAGHRAFNAAYQASEYFHDWARPQGLGDIAGCHMNRSHGPGIWIGIRRPLDRGPFSRRDLGLLRTVVPHVARGLMLYQRVDHERMSRGAGAAALDAIGFPIVVLTAHGRILRLNTEGEELLRRGDILSSRNGSIVCHRHADTAALMTAVGLAASGKASAPSVEDVVIRDSEGNRSIVQVAPLPSARSLGSLSAQSAAVALFVPGTADSAPSIRAFARLHQLTPAETRLLDEIVKAEGLVEAAKRLGIALTTARTHLQQIFAKSGTTKQAALLRAVLGTAAPIRRR